MGDPELLLVAEIHGLAGSRAELHGLLSELAQRTRDEQGCASFWILSAEEPGEFVLLESWASESALRAHYDTAHYRHYREQVGPLLARPSDVVIHRLAGSVRALDPNPPDPGEFG